jgi:hypothetical protein
MPAIFAAMTARKIRRSATSVARRGNGVGPGYLAHDGGLAACFRARGRTRLCYQRWLGAGWACSRCDNERNNADSVPATAAPESSSNSTDKLRGPDVSDMSKEALALAAGSWNGIGAGLSSSVAATLADATTWSASATPGARQNTKPSAQAQPRATPAP